jgi:Ran GTPase-activating protein (RanGAP) involved in mRNA processing and transport
MFIRVRDVLVLFIRRLVYSQSIEVLPLHENKMMSLSEIFLNSIYCIHIMSVYEFKKFESVLLFCSY